MNETTANWLAEKLKIPGVIACGIRSSEDETLANSNAPEFTPDAVATACRCLSDTFEMLQTNQFAIDFVRWVYETYFVYGAVRPDGKCLAVLTARKTSPRLEQKEIEQIVAEFQQLET